MSHRCQRKQRRTLEEVLQDLVAAQGRRAQEEAAAAAASAVIPSILEEVPSAAAPSPPQSPQGAASLPTGLASTPGSQCDESSSKQEGEPSTLQEPAYLQPLLQHALEEKISNLVHFLLLKYQIKEPITKDEMLNIVIQEYGDHFPEIFKEASDCMQLVFGVDVKEVDPVNHCYVLVTALGLSYDEMLNDFHGLPKVGLLIIILGLIFLEGNRAPEEVIWQALSMMGVHDGWEHFIYGEPRKLITHDWVREGYLVYRQVPQSDPVHCEFLWGPRAHAETSKMKVLEYVARINGNDPRSFPHLYEEALRDEERRAWARVAAMVAAGAGPVYDQGPF
ncbi:melanoma-associated antigen 8-like [Nycticebus coucang]|uniref:melanoma-associated antigen 8-like n=1 Tax=Nycticebus coucang TaxID=9470 RepID=UPI00234C4546|nr:melanoma-associated antigen 8-like [Nycticebus coucang]